MTGASAFRAMALPFGVGQGIFDFARTGSPEKLKSLVGKPFMYKLIKGAIHAWMDETYHANFMDDNKDLFLRNPAVKVSTRGTEFTSFMQDIERSGFLRSKPVRFAGDIPVIGQAGRVYGGFFKGSARAFEMMIDYAGGELLKAHEDLAVDPKSRQQLADFVNAIRGVGTAERIGVSRGQRQWETIFFLAQGYNRSIAALITQIFKGGVSGKLARQKISHGITGLIAMAIAISMARGEDVDEMLEHFDPDSPMFLTWNIGGQNIGPGSKVRSLIKLSAGIAVSVHPDAEVNITDFRNKDHPAVRFVRGLASPFIGDVTDILTGRNFLGEKVSFLEPWTVAEHILLPKVTPLWAQSVAMDGGSARERSIRGVAEFGGWRAYPEGAYQILNNYSKEYLNIDYRDLEPFERKMLRDILKEELDPMTYERAQQGDSNAMYWIELDIRDTERLEKEKNALEVYFNPQLSDDPEWKVNGQRKLLQLFNDIQEEFARERNELNNTFGMYQDDNDFDADDPDKHALGAWYNVFDECVDSKTGEFNSAKYQSITEQYFWTRTNPEGGAYSQSEEYIIRNTHNTEHDPSYYQLLPSYITDKWITSEEARRKFIGNRGNWKALLDKVGLGQ